MARIHYHEFYCFDGVPLELEDDEGERITIKPWWIKPEGEDRFNRKLEEEIERDLIFLRNWKPDKPDWWIVIVYWNDGRFGTHRGVGKKPKVLN